MNGRFLLLFSLHHFHSDLDSRSFRVTRAHVSLFFVLSLHDFLGVDTSWLVTTQRSGLFFYPSLPISLPPNHLPQFILPAPSPSLWWPNRLESEYSASIHLARPKVYLFQESSLPLLPAASSPQPLPNFPFPLNRSHSPKSRAYFRPPHYLFASCPTRYSKQEKNSFQKRPARSLDICVPPFDTPLSQFPLGRYRGCLGTAQALTPFSASIDPFFLIQCSLFNSFLLSWRSSFLPRAFPREPFTQMWQPSPYGDPLMYLIHQMIREM